MARPDSSPSEAAKKLSALKLTDPKAWAREIKDAFAGGATLAEAADRLGGMSHMTVMRHVRELEEKTGRRLPRPTSGRKDGT